MLSPRRNGSSETVTLPCVLNRASLGDAEYVFVVIDDLLTTKVKVAWVPREDLEIEKQQFQGREIKARLTVNIKEEKEDKYLVSVINRGNEEILAVPKNDRFLLSNH